MRKSRFNEEQIIGILREAEGTSVKAVCARHNISAATYGWKAKFGGMDVNEARRLRALEDENRRLKNLVADGSNLHPERGELKKVVSPSQKRRAIKHVVEEGKGTTAEACRALGLQRSTYYRNSTISPERQELERVIVALSEDHPRYGSAVSLSW